MNEHVMNRLQMSKKQFNVACEDELSSSSIELQINELRGRLDRRNALLDAIRKAYHRDVLVIKECLIDAHTQCIITNVDDAESLSLLASVPSIDLRETFRLFAPQDCELRVRPCWSCGGQLEVIHRESARIVNFKHSIHLMEEKEKDLHMELIDTKVKAQGDRECLLEVVDRSKGERDVLIGQILSLKHQVADRNALDAQVKQLQIEKKDLETTLNQQQPILTDHKRLVVEIEEVKEDAKQWRAKFCQQVEQNTQVNIEKDSLAQQINGLQQENEQLRQTLQEAREQCQQSDDQCSTLTHELSKSKAATKEIEGCLYKAEHAIDELESEFQQEKQQLKVEINDLESKCLDLQATIVDLEGESQTNAEEADYFRKKIGATLEGAKRRGSIAFVPQNRDAAFAKTDELIQETEHLRLKTATLFNLLLSCIRSAYENCLKQEGVLVDNGSELHRNNRKLMASAPINSKARIVLNHLDDADDSDAIPWASILANETDQRHILGNLQNRLQMGQFSLDKAFQKIYKAQAAELRKCQDEHHKQIEERRSRIWNLEKMLTEAISVNRKYEDRMIKMREKYDSVEPKIDSIRCALRKIRRDCIGRNDTKSKLEDDYKNMCALTNRILDELRSSREKIQTQEEDITEKQEDICNRDAAIEQLEGLLQKITHKYAENERLRIKVTHEVSVQAVPAVANSASHADFLPTPLRGVATATENKKPSDALLPGRIFNITDENWPRVNVGSQLKYRRAIDKL